MIDTITLMLNQNEFAIQDHNKFEPSTEHLFTPPYDIFKGKKVCKQWPKFKDTKEYFPRLTVIKSARVGGYSIALYIEFSIPKLIFRNNFDEVIDDDFDKVIITLFEKLMDMGVFVESLQILKNANVSKIHYAKNIVLENYLDMYLFMQALSKININKRYDFAKTDFLNEGHALRYRSNEYEVTFYDKKKDYEQSIKSEKKALEKDNKILQQTLKRINLSQDFEVLRIEVRWGSRRKIKAELKKLKVTQEVSFVTLYSSNLSQLVIKSILSDIRKIYPSIIFNTSNSYEKSLIELLLFNKNLSFSKALSFIGMKAILSEVGIIDFRQITKKFNKSNWYRFNKEMNNLIYPNKQRNIIDKICTKVDEFKTVRLIDFVD